ncbi:MAG: glycyl-radical enzyme activating protein [Bacteroidota bacterium]
MNRGLIFDIRRFSVNDGPGIRTTVFFKGCPLSCWWCHNPESRDFQPETSTKHLISGGKTFDHEEITGKWMTVAEVLEEVLKDRIFYDESGGGVTLSGGEPLLQEAFLVELLKACRQEGLHMALDTSGYSDNLSFTLISGWVDLFLYDLKMINDEKHLEYTGVSNKPILENLRFLYRTGKNVILRYPVIPGITDTIENVNDMKELISHLQIPKSSNPQIVKSPDFQISLLPFHSLGKEKYRRFSKTNKLSALSDLKKEDLHLLKRAFEAIGGTVHLGG